MINLFLIATFLFVPYVSQTTPYGCGEASVSMVIAHYKGEYIEPDIFLGFLDRDKYTNINDILIFLASYGISAKRGSRIIQYPAIVLIYHNHWVVAIDENTYHDPLYGPNQQGYTPNIIINITEIIDGRLVK